MEFVLQIGLLIIGFVLLIKGADIFVDGSSGIAAKFGIPQLVIGLTIVAMGTSAPELAVSISAASFTADTSISIEPITAFSAAILFGAVFIISSSIFYTLINIPIAFQPLQL